MCAFQVVISKKIDQIFLIGLMRCDELLDACDYEGARNYQAIILRINRLLETSTGSLQ